MDLFGLRADGSRFPAEIRLAPLESSAQMLTATIIRDVTEHHRLMSELAAARAVADSSNEGKSRFLGAVSHDLRQPLQALRLLNGVLRRQANDAGMLGTIDEQHRALDVMSDLVNAVLNVSKLESGTVEAVMTGFSVNSVFEEVREPLGPTAEAKGLHLDVQASDLNIRTDRTLFRQLLQNLVSNAVRYTDAGCVTLRAMSHGVGTVDVTVGDTGIGIPPNALKTIFQDFVQVNRPGDAVRGGVGLGLGTVRRIADLLGLQIRVESTVGVGSKFSIAVPKSETIDDLVGIEALKTGAVFQPSSRLVLVVDDHQSMRNAIVMYLETVEGYTVKAVGSVDEVAQFIQTLQDAPAIVVSDYHLGHGVFGTDAIDLVRNKFGAGVPVIMLTGDTSAIIERIAASPATALLNKPIDVAVLTALMSQMIEASIHEWAPYSHPACKSARLHRA